jgi:molecular chaperone DnaJ
MDPQRDYYEVLGVGRDASQEDIKRAYRRLARELHPDVNPSDPQAEEKFKGLTQAYEVLGDPQKRHTYDLYGTAEVPAMSFEGFPGWGGFEDIFDTFLWGASRQTAGRRATTTAERGADLRLDLEITLEEAAFGAERPLRVSHLVTCEKCRGTGARTGAHHATCPTCGGAGEVRTTRGGGFISFTTITQCARCAGEGTVVTDPCPDCRAKGLERRTDVIRITVPAGVDAGEKLRLAGMGHAGLRGGPPGDLYVVIHVQPHEIFERRGAELVCEVSLPFVMAALGGEVQVPTLEGTHSLHIPPGTQNGTTFRLRGQGLPDLGRSQRGDLHVVVKVAVPTKLTDKQRKILEEFSKAGGDTLTEEKGFFHRKQR